MQSEEGLSDMGEYITAEVICSYCGHKWIGVAPKHTKQLECSKCGYFTDSPTLKRPDVHVVLSEVGNHIYLNTSTVLHRSKVIYLLQEGLSILYANKREWLDTKENTYQVFLTALSIDIENRDA